MDRKAVSVFIALTMVAAFVIAIPAGAHQLPDDFSGYEDPAECGGCHDAIYREWQGSMHAKSSKFADPLHGALANMFVKAMEAKGGKGNYHCANCHTPTADNMAALMKGEAAPDPANPTNRNGVTCSFCHKVDGVVEGDKFHSYRMSSEIRGASDNPDSPHGVKMWNMEETYNMCLGCHGKKVSGKGGVICSMEEEGITDCNTCHMERLDGPPAKGSDRNTHLSHALAGGHDPDMLKKGASISLSAEGGKLKVTLVNPNPHSFPSTNPLRMAYVVVVVSDASGKPVYKNMNTAPTDDPQAVLMKTFEGGGQVGVPSWEAEGVASDTRLKPGETRVLTYDLPEGAVSATAMLVYRFAPPKALEKMGLASESAVSEPQMVSSAKIEF